VNLVSAHTNLDFAAGGTSHALAERLGLREMRFLRTSYQLQKKLVTFVPAAAVETVARAMATAGAGVLGNYEECSFRVNGTGTFRGGEHTQPVVGRPGRLERVPEIRLEMVVPGPAVDRVVSALKATHPYEEVAYDIYPTENRSNEYGMGVIGTLQPPASLRSFLGSVRKTLGIPHLRFCRGRSTMVRRVAVCGGNGGDLLDDAVRQDADAFVTADVSYHRFHEASGRIVLIDAGHCETESPVVTSLAERLRTAFHDRGERVRVTAATVSTNPIQHV
jgi:putative NIF3 family GTP cyclohydrolase 1 type 2